jgi:hypothetical protein
MPGSRLVKIRIEERATQEIVALVPASASDAELQALFGEEDWERPHVGGGTIDKDNSTVTEVRVVPIVGGCNPAADLDVIVSRDGDGKLQSARHVSTVSSERD